MERLALGLVIADVHLMVRPKNGVSNKQYKQTTNTGVAIEHMR